MDFYAEHADDIIKMDIVGDPHWKEDATMFTGAGIRSTAIEYFQPSQLGLARAFVA